jgi:hypothetical protein
LLQRPRKDNEKYFRRIESLKSGGGRKREEEGKERKRRRRKVWEKEGERKWRRRRETRRKKEIEEDRGCRPTRVGLAYNYMPVLAAGKTYARMSTVRDW